VLTRKLAADTELSVKNGAELLDRLIKDIVAESAATYVSVLKQPEGKEPEEGEMQTAFSLPRFIPLLQERITVLSPHTRMFLVGWITLLDSIPDLELVSYLPSFLGGLFKFLNDENQDVHTATQAVLDRFLSEIKKIARLKQGLAQSQKGKAAKSDSDSSSDSGNDTHTTEKDAQDTDSLASGTSVSVEDDASDNAEDDWIPGQDIQLDYSNMLEILVSFLSANSGKSFGIVAIANNGRTRNPTYGFAMDRQLFRDLSRGNASLCPTTTGPTAPIAIQ
jgi:vacuole morphology and inheritance protein 14